MTRQRETNSTCRTKPESTVHVRVDEYEERCETGPVLKEENLIPRPP